MKNKWLSASAFMVVGAVLVASGVIPRLSNVAAEVVASEPEVRDTHLMHVTFKTEKTAEWGEETVLRSEHFSAEEICTDVRNLSEGKTVIDVINDYHTIGKSGEKIYASLAAVEGFSLQQVCVSQDGSSFPPTLLAGTEGSNGVIYQPENAEGGKTRLVKYQPITDLVEGTEFAIWYSESLYRFVVATPWADAGHSWWDYYVLDYSSTSDMQSSTSADLVESCHSWADQEDSEDMNMVECTREYTP